MSDRASALVAMGLFTPVKWQARFAGWVARGLVRVFGPRMLPGRAFEWDCPITPEIWEQLIAEWAAHWGTFETIAVYERTHISHPGLGFLFMRHGTPIAFAKVRQTDVESLENEARAMRLVWRHQPSSFNIPEPLAYGRVGAWHYLAMSPLPGGSHSVPRSTLLDPIIEDIHMALQDLPREPSAPGHWEPMHGDLTPWNLRRIASGGLVLIDWECSGWGPPGTDEVLYAMTNAVASGRRPTQVDAAEAVEFWHARISSWPNLSGRAGEYRKAMLRALEQSRRSASSNRLMVDE
jgi:hypothetical protein